MGERDEVQVARWAAIRERVGECLRQLRTSGEPTSQARLSGDLEDLGFHVTQSMISRYEQGQLDAPLTLERLVGWALCCASLSAPAFRELMELAGFYLPLSQEDLAHFDELLRRYRALPLPDQIVLRRKLLWHVLGLREQDEPFSRLAGAPQHQAAQPAGQRAKGPRR
jgi:transcriptional regulator with XRE-family HTH domain